MSFRIEHSHPLTLLRELPNSWAQTCITTPPPDQSTPYLLAVLDEIHRVLRPDGTTWLTPTTTSHKQELQYALKETNWLLPQPANAIPRQTLLLAKQPTFLFRSPRLRPAAVWRCGQLSPGSFARSSSWGCTGCGRRRRAWCLPSARRSSMAPASVIEWCVLAGTTPSACEVCGAPSRQRSPRQWQAACAHLGSRGRCLVLDPFCRTGEVAVHALGHGRHYLGINPDHAGAAAARARLTRALERTP